MGANHNWLRNTAAVKKVAFLDRDGTIIRDYPDQLWGEVDEPEFLPGSFEALRQLVLHGWEIVVVTNQYLIGEGFITLDQYKRFAVGFEQRLLEQGIELLDTRFCPHARSAGCLCCKPATGMIDDVLENHPTIDMSNSFVVGDSLCDIELGLAVGAGRIFGLGIGSGIEGVTQVNSLAEVTLPEVLGSITVS